MAVLAVALMMVAATSQSGTTWTAPAIVSIAIAGIALLLSFVALVRSARRAKLLAVVNPALRFYAGSWGRLPPGMPGGNSVVVQLTISNVGSAGTVIDSLSVTEFNVESTRPLLGPMTASSGRRQTGGYAEQFLPQVVAAGATDLYGVSANFPLHDEVVGDREEFARRLNGLRAARVKIVWSWFRPSLWPWKRQPNRVTKDLTVDFEPASYITSVRDAWATQGEEDLLQLSRQGTGGGGPPYRPQPRPRSWR